MQIKLATARGLGYTGDAEGLRDPDTNLTYGVKYLAGAYRAANGDHDRAVHYYASGYYDAAKRQRLEALKRAGPALASAPADECQAAASREAEQAAKQAAKCSGPGAASMRSAALRNRGLRPDHSAANSWCRKRSASAGQHSAGAVASRVDTPRHRPTLDLFRGELR